MPVSPAASGVGDRKGRPFWLELADAGCVIIEYKQPKRDKTCLLRTCSLLFPFVLNKGFLEASHLSQCTLLLLAFLMHPSNNIKSVLKFIFFSGFLLNFVCACVLLILINLTNQLSVLILHHNLGGGVLPFHLFVYDKRIFASVRQYGGVLYPVPR